MTCNATSQGAHAHERTIVVAVDESQVCLDKLICSPSVIVFLCFLHCLAPLHLRLRAAAGVPGSV